MDQTEQAGAVQQEQEEEAEPVPLKPVTRCVLCHKSNVWRIQLRVCQHSVCVACLLLHLRFWIASKSKARIKCPKRKCPVRIHENDIDALLDGTNDDLDLFMPLSEREWLLHQHRKHSILYAFGGEAKQCPLCKSMYTEYDGCHYVQCVNTRCKQNWCWQCTQPINSVQHFFGGECSVGWDDLWKLCYLFRFLTFSDGMIFALISPIFSIAILCFSPPMLVFLFAWYGTERARVQLRQWALGPLAITAAVAVVFPVLLILGSPMFIGCSYLAICMSMWFIVVAVAKNLPVVSKVFDILSMVEMVAGCCGLDSWRSILKDGKEARRKREVELRQQELERTEMDVELGKGAVAAQPAIPPPPPPKTGALETAKGFVKNIPIIGTFWGMMPGMQ